MIDWKGFAESWVHKMDTLPTIFSAFALLLALVVVVMSFLVKKRNQVVTEDIRKLVAERKEIANSLERVLGRPEAAEGAPKGLRSERFVVVENIDELRALWEKQLQQGLRYSRGAETATLKLLVGARLMRKALTVKQIDWKEAGAVSDKHPTIDKLTEGLPPWPMFDRPGSEDALGRIMKAPNSVQ